MTVFRLDESAGAGTHVFLVGVGEYDHLRGGNGKPMEEDGGMGQLTSCPVSAMAMLGWFDLVLKNPRAPLKSIEVLISQEGNPAEYLNPAGQMQQIERATYENFEKSAKAWFDRASSDPDNVAVFYFCGHGLGDGITTQLLLSDYGASTEPLRHAINFNAFRMAMHACKAMNQIFFVDACRVVNSRLLIDPFSLGQSGLGRVNPTKMFRGSNPVMFAARVGAQAFGNQNEVSDFTTALLAAMTKHGVRRNKRYEWAVSPQALQLAVAALMEDFSGTSHCQTDGLSGQGFDLHLLDADPEAVVLVSFAPAHRHVGAQLRASCGTIMREREGSDHPWRTTLPVGNSEISATFPLAAGLNPVSRIVPLLAPLQEIELEVQ